VTSTHRRRSSWGAAIQEYGPAVGLIGLLIVGWEVGTREFGIKPVILPSPTKILETLVIDRELFAANVGLTLIEVALGFIVGFAFGLGAAIGIVRSRIFAGAVYPIVIVSQMIPVFAIAPLLIVWLGFGIEPKVVIVALAVFFPITINMVAGLQDVDLGVLNLMRSYSARERQVLWMVRLPASLPYLRSASEVAVTYAVIAAVIAEWIGAEAGIGKVMIQANAILRTDRVFVGIFLTSALALGLFAFVRIVGRRLSPWEAAVNGR
jgi:NitT/TauT family transport system permease protein